ncbi:MAG TPA: hypothetical protein VIO57_13745 [Chloroflexota bacterium]
MAFDIPDTCTLPTADRPIRLRRGPDPLGAQRQPRFIHAPHLAPARRRCCALPYLIVGGLITGAGVAVLQQGLIAGAIGLGVFALGMWWLRRRQLAKRAAAAGVTGCGDVNCVC